MILPIWDNEWVYMICRESDCFYHLSKLKCVFKGLHTKTQSWKSCWKHILYKRIYIINRKGYFKEMCKTICHLHRSHHNSDDSTFCYSFYTRFGLFSKYFLLWTYYLDWQTLKSFKRFLFLIHTFDRETHDESGGRLRPPQCIASSTWRLTQSLDSCEQDRNTADGK